MVGYVIEMMYRTQAIKTALHYKLQMLGSKIEEFSCLVSTLIVSVKDKNSPQKAKQYEGIDLKKSF